MSLTEVARDIFAEGLAAVDARRLVADAVRREGLERPVLVVGGGKAAAAMAAGVEDVFGPLPGIVIVPRGYELPTQGIEVCFGGHPLPTEEGVANAMRLADAVHGADGPVLACISGGGSATLAWPTIPLEQLNARVAQMLKDGAPIEALNRMRRGVMRLANGGLANLTGEMVGLVLSDVVGDDVATIASGPTLGVRNILVGSNDTAVDAAVAAARARGFRPRVIRGLAGEAREVGAELAGFDGCVIAGGETTVTVRGDGIGGRNQELALAAAIALRDTGSDAVVLSAGTDGRDGPTDAAGAVVDATIATTGAEEALDGNDSHTWLAAHAALVVTGPTRTNVMDLQIRLE